MNPITTFFGVSDIVKPEQEARLQAQLDDLYKQLAQVQASLYNLKTSTSTTNVDTVAFLDNLRNTQYPGLHVDILSTVPPVSLDFETHATSFFYSDARGRLMYVDAPVHWWQIQMTRQGIQRISNIGIGRCPTSVGDINVYNSRIYRRISRFGHPHLMNSDTERSVTSHWCFGNMTDVPNLIHTANDVQSISILFRDLYHWLTEINIDSTYHNFVSPVETATYDVTDQVASFGYKLYDSYKECFSKVIDLINKDAWDEIYIETTQPVMDVIKEEYRDAPDILRAILRNALEAFSNMRNYPLECTLFLYQFATACVLANTCAHGMNSLIRNALEADWYYLPWAWQELAGRRFRTHVVSGGFSCSYKRIYKHYYDAFNYALKGDF